MSDVETAQSTANSDDESVILNGSETDSEVAIIDLTFSDTDSNSTNSSVIIVNDNLPELHPLNVMTMLNIGTGTLGHLNCKLQLKASLIRDAGTGVFVREGCSIINGEIITAYTGTHIAVNNIENLTDFEKLRCFRVGNVCMFGRRPQQLVHGDGFGSVINSSTDRFRPNCRCISHAGHIYIIAVVNDQYPIIGLSELYLTTGVSWWATFRRVLNQNYTVAEINML